METDPALREWRQRAFGQAADWLFDEVQVVDLQPMERRLVGEPVRVRAGQADAEQDFVGRDESSLRGVHGGGIGRDVIGAVEPDVGHAEVERNLARSQFDADAVAMLVVLDDQFGTMLRHREGAERDLSVPRIDRRVLVADWFEIAAEDLDGPW